MEFAAALYAASDRDARGRGLAETPDAGRA